MTWFGKILTFVVMVASVVWMYFTVAAYVNRTNWHDRAAALETALRQSEEARKHDLAVRDAEVASLKGLLATEENLNASLNSSLDALQRHVVLGDQREV